MRGSLLVLALLLALSGCGGDDDSSAPPDLDIPSLTPTGSDGASGSADPTRTTKPTPEVSRSEAKAARRTFDTWFGAFGSGSGDRACSLQTKAFTKSQVKRLAEQDRIEPGASCDDLVTIVGILFEALQLDVGNAEIARAPSENDEVAFTVKFPKFATLGYGLVDTKQGWRVDQDLTIH